MSPRCSIAWPALLAMAACASPQTAAVEKIPPGAQVEVAPASTITASESSAPPDGSATATAALPAAPWPPEPFHVVATLGAYQTVDFFPVGSRTLLIVSSGQHPGDDMRAAWVEGEDARYDPQALEGLPPHGALELGTLGMGFPADSPYVQGRKNFGRRQIEGLVGNDLDSAWLVSAVSGAEPIYDCAYEVFRWSQQRWQRSGAAGRQGRCLAGFWPYQGDGLLALWRDRDSVTHFEVLGAASGVVVPRFQRHRAPPGEQGTCADALSTTRGAIRVFPTGAVVAVGEQCASRAPMVVRWSGRSPVPATMTLLGLSPWHTPSVEFLSDSELRITAKGTLPVNRPSPKGAVAQPVSVQLSFAAGRWQVTDAKTTGGGESDQQRRRPGGDEKRREQVNALFREPFVQPDGTTLERRRTWVLPRDEAYVLVAHVKERRELEQVLLRNKPARPVLTFPRLR